LLLCGNDFTDRSQQVSSVGFAFMQMSRRLLLALARSFVHSVPLVHSNAIAQSLLLLVQLSGLMVAFLSAVDARNAGAIVFATLERGAAVVKQLMLEQLQSAETDAHILKASQVRVSIQDCYPQVIQM
jgi:hypothetical protein